MELGSGTADKTRVLLDALLQRDGAVRYQPVDVSAGALRAAKARVEADLPGVRVTPFEGTYDEALRALTAEHDTPHLLLFLGSSLGNLEQADARSFLGRVASALGPEDLFLLATDLSKDPAVLLDAYDDDAGVTAAFNRNLLARLNRELEANFDLDAFRHQAVYDADAHRVEMHLVSTRPQTVRVSALNLTVDFAAGETIHTENSYKYTLADVAALTEGAGLRLLTTWTDAADWYAVHLLGRAESTSADGTGRPEDAP